MSKLHRFIGLVAVLALSIPSFGQVLKGSISGTVVDPNKAVIVGAEVKATNTETGEVKTEATDNSGSFRFNLIPAGTYKLAILAKGFNTKEITQVAVSAGADAGLGSIAMKIGESTTVEVSTSAPLIETSQAQVTSTFSGTT